MPSVAILPNSPGSMNWAKVDSASSTIAAIAGVQGKYIRVYKMFLVVGAPTNITFLDGANPFDGALPLIANGSIVLDIDGTPWFPCSDGNAFNIGNSGSVQVSGTLYYYLDNAA